MAAGLSTFGITTPAVSVPKFLFSPFPFASLETQPRHVKLPRPRLAARSSSLLASEMPPRDNADIQKMESAFSSLFLDVEKSLDDAKVESSGVNQVNRAPSDNANVEGLGVNPRTGAPLDHRKVSSLAADKMAKARSVDGKADSLGVNRRSRAPWNILEAAKEESTKAEGPGALPYRDSSLQYANVMWFKGAYNVEILCREDEPEESIVRRFRAKVREAGVIMECQRRRYLETKQDTVKRKKRIASMNRKRNRSSPNGSNAWTQNAWTLSREGLKPVDRNKKKKTSRKQYGPSRFNAKTGGSDKKDDIDDDYWGFVEEEEEGVQHEASRRPSH